MRAPLIYLAWVVSVVATLGSLYFSEVRLFVPCTLCWYQRILMYPLAILLAIASYRQDRGVVKYALPLSVLGIAVSGFHYLEQKVPWISSSAVCRSGVPCEIQYINWLGFVTIPLLAFVAFTLITVMLVSVARQRAVA
ncbi:MAG: disulfide bond formation protein B [Deinococcales bacterium]|nr:disulfide bond formation protein B [Deinococcales bacterium]